MMETSDWVHLTHHAGDHAVNAGASEAIALLGIGEVHEVPRGFGNLPAGRRSEGG